jgi:hypothetical protein
MMITEGRKSPLQNKTEERFMNSCLCNLFHDNWVWLIILAVILISCCNNGCGYGTNYNNGCGCGTNYNNGCGCGCG